MQDGEKRAIPTRKKNKSYKLPYPFYKESKDKGFIEACDAHLADKLMRLAWWEHERDMGDFYPMKAGKAFCFYHRKDGAVVGLWKWALAALSYDEGKSWEPASPVKCPTITAKSAKSWGQRTDDGRYAMLYDPSVPFNYQPRDKDFIYRRWPLVVITSDDGITFDNMAVVHGEVPPRRYEGAWKTIGPQYIRGIAEGNGNPPGDDMWVTYSVGREDIWVSRVPLPIRQTVGEPVDDSFDNMEIGGVVTDWNIYSPTWAPVSVAAVPGESNRGLKLQDREPYDYARAVRVFPESSKLDINFRVMAEKTDTGRLEIDVLGADGSRPVRIYFSDVGRIAAVNGNRTEDLGAYMADAWISFMVRIDVPDGTFSISVDGKTVLKDALFAEPVNSVERLSFRTGVCRHLVEVYPEADKPDSEKPVESVVYYIDDVVTGKHVASR